MSAGHPNERDYVASALRAGLFTKVVGKRVVHLATTGSTMDDARRLAEEGAQDGTVVVSDAQTGGRGRFGRRWVSPPDNLYLSVLLRPDAAAAQYVSVAACVAVVRAIRRTAGLVPRVKWPNDVLLRGKKVSGLLVESVLGESGTGYSIVGIGVNVELDPSATPEIAAIATSLRAEAAKPPLRSGLLRALLHELDALYDDLRRGSSPVPEWKLHLDTLGKQVDVRWGDEVHTGIAEDVDERGALVLRRADGTAVLLPAGEVTLHRV